MNVKELMSRAQFFYDKEDFKKTLTFLNKILRAYPDFKPAKELMSKCKKRNSLEPYINHFLEYASKLYAEGRIKEAIEQVNKALSTDPQSKKAAAVLEKLNSEIKHGKGIEPFAEDLIPSQAFEGEDSPFLFEEEEPAADDATGAAAQDEAVFHFSDEPSAPEQDKTQAQEDDFVFSLDDNAPPEEKKPHAAVEDFDHPAKLVDDAPDMDHQAAIAEDAELAPPPPATGQADTPAQPEEQPFSADDFEFATDKKDEDEIFALKKNVEAPAKSDDSFAEKDLFDFEEEAKTTPLKPGDMEFEEAEPGFFTDKTEAPPQFAEKPLLKPKEMTSENLLNKFQEGLKMFKELKLKEALDIFTMILTYEKQFKDDFPDLFEESRQLFLEIKSKLSQDAPSLEEDAFTIGQPELEQESIQSQITIKRQSLMNKTRMYTIIAVAGLILVSLVIVFLNSQKKAPAPDPATSQPVASEKPSEDLTKKLKVATKLEKAKDMQKIGNTAEARDLLEEVISIDPDNLEAIQMLNKIKVAHALKAGNAAFDVEDYKTAYEHFYSVYQLAPNTPGVKDKLSKSKIEMENNSNLYARIAKYREDKRVLKDIPGLYKTIQAIQKDYPNFAFVNNEYEEMSKLKISHDERITQARIKQYMDSGDENFKLNLWNLAIKGYKQALALAADDPTVKQKLYKSFYNLGLDALKIKSINDAYWALNEAHKMNPKDRELRELLAMTENHLEKEISPEFSSYINSLVYKQ